jgi:antitoxin FitA
LTTSLDKRDYLAGDITTGMSDGVGSRSTRGGRDLHLWAGEGDRGSGAPHAGASPQGWPASAVLAFCRQRCHREDMSVQITIRDVPDAVKDELAARAALQGRSMQEYLRAELERLAARPPIEKVLERIRERKATAGTRLPPEEILARRDVDRR